MIAMYGLVNRALEEMIRSGHGDATWDAIKARAGVDIDVFIRMEQYPDGVTHQLVGATCEILGLSPDEALKAFGEYWVLYTGSDGYGEFLDSAGGSVFEFLGNLNDLHSRVGVLYENLSPPSFECSDVTAGSLVLHYYSKRDGLAPMIIGLVTGLGKRFNTPVSVHPLTEKSRGDDHDSFIVTLSPHD
jgi:hypothetical protein